MHRLEPRRRAGHGARGLTDPEDLGRLAVAAEGHVDRVHLRLGGRRTADPGRRDEEVRHPRRAPVGRDDEREAAGPRAGQRALGHPGRERGGHAGIDGVPALLEHPGARGGGQRVTRGNSTLHEWPPDSR